MNEPTIEQPPFEYYAYVDAPGEKPMRNTIAVEAVRGYTDTQGMEVPARYDELTPNSDGVFELPTDHANHTKRRARLKLVQSKLARRSGGRNMLVGPFDEPEDCLKARYAARPKTESEHLALVTESHTSLIEENATLREKIAELSRKSGGTAQAPKTVAPVIE